VYHQYKENRLHPLHLLPSVDTKIRADFVAINRSFSHKCLSTKCETKIELCGTVFYLMSHFNHAYTIPDTVINCKSFPDVNFHAKKLFLLNTSGENFLP
jgi:hypothetical protein